MSHFLRYLVAAVLVVLAATQPVQAQQNAPHLGYVYPAGGRQGTTFTAVVGGQFLNSATGVFVTETGVSATIVERERQLTPQEQKEFMEKLAKLQEKRKNGERLTPEEIKSAEEIRKKLIAFGRRLANPALSEFVTLQITVAQAQCTGKREVRVATPAGLSNPLPFNVGQLPEISKPDWKNIPRARGSTAPALPAPSETAVSLPAMLNGQIPPGGVDRYRFTAHKGAAAGRGRQRAKADPLPGRRRAGLVSGDGGDFRFDGNELTYADHYRFHPDPVLSCKIPKNGQYVLEIRDTLYRGREDFVYRVAVGDLPL